MKPLSPGDPTTIGPYRLVGVLGGGGMGRVYLGHSATGRRLAIKVLRAELVDDPEYRERFAREVSAARLVSPMFTAALMDADPHAEAPWLATRYIEGPSLSQWVREAGPLAPRTVMTLAAGLAEALASIHRVGLVHRDLKPSNVLIDDEGPHIIDFGIALLPDATRMTASLVMGTPSYTAPERIRGEEATEASDIFALGATLYYAATGRTLIGQGTAYQQVMQITAGQFDLSELSPTIKPLITMCLSPRAQDRPRATELVHVLVGAGINPPTLGWRREPSQAPPAFTEAAEPRNSRRALLISGAVGGGLVLAGGAAWAVDLLPGGDDPPLIPTGNAGGSSPSPKVSATPPGSQIMTEWVVTVPTPARGATGGYALGNAAFVTSDHQVISAQGSTVISVGPDRKPNWQLTLTGAVDVAVRPWRGGVLCNDANRVWFLTPKGVKQWDYDAVTPEKAAIGRNGPADADIRINAVVAGVAHVFINVGTALIAIDPNRTLVWRKARLSNGFISDLATIPIAANSRCLVARDANSFGQQRVSLYDVADVNHRYWSELDKYGSNGAGNPPGGGPGGGGPGSEGGPGGSQGPGPAGVDDAWYHLQARIGPTLVAVRDNQQITVRRLTDGRDMKHFPQNEPVADIAVVDDLLLISTSMLRAYDQLTGAYRWQVELPGARTTITPTGDLYAVSSRTIAQIDDGRVALQGNVPADLASLIPIRVVADDQAVYATFADPSLATCNVVAFTVKA